jgi:hypothetical protein
MYLGVSCVPLPGQHSSRNKSWKRSKPEGGSSNEVPGAITWQNGDEEEREESSAADKSAGAVRSIRTDSRFGGMPPLLFSHEL